MKIAVAVMCFNRPHYLEPVLRSFEEADEVNELDWFFFQDGAVNYYSEVRYTDDKPLNAVTKLIEDSTLPNKKLIKQEYNISPAQQRYNMYTLLDDYDLLYVFDDDMIVGQHYFSLLRKMAEQFKRNTGILYTNHSAKPVKQNLDKVTVKKIARLWGHYMWRDNWLKFRKDHTIYYNFMKEKDFFIYRRQGPFTDMPKEMPHISDDKVVNELCRRYNIRKLVPRVSRAKYIGKFGTLAYKEDRFWIKKGMHKQSEIITHAGDGKLKAFKKV